MLWTNSNIGKPSGEKTYILKPFFVVVLFTVTRDLLRSPPSRSSSFRGYTVSFA